MDDNSLLNETLAAQPEIEYSLESKTVKSIKVLLPNNCYLYGTISLDPSDKYARIGVMFVNNKIQGQGIAAKLFETFLKEVLKHNIEKISGYSTNINALKAAAKFIGEDKLKIKDLDTNIVISLEQAQEKPDKNYYAEIDLKDLQ